MPEFDEFGIPIRKGNVSLQNVDEFGIPIKKKEPLSSKSLPTPSSSPLQETAKLATGEIFGDISKGIAAQEQLKPKPKAKKAEAPHYGQFIDIGQPIAQEVNKSKAVIPESGPMPWEMKQITKGQIQGKIANILSAGKRPTVDELGEIAALNKELQSMPRSEAEIAFEKDGFGIFKKNPLLGVQFLGETMLSSLSSLAESGKRTVPTAVGMGAAMGAPIAGIGAVAGAATGLTAGLLTGGYNISTSQDILNSLSDNGVDISDKDSLINAFSDEKRMAKIRSTAAKYGVPILAFDALTSGIAGKLIGGAVGKSLSKKIIAGMGEAGIQAVGGSGGELAGQLASGKKVNWDEVALEGIASLATDVPDITVGAMIERRNASSNNKTLATQIAVQGNEAGLEDAKINLDRDLKNGVISEEEHQDGVKFIEKAAEINTKIPETVQGENRAKSIELINERDKLTEEINQKEEQKKSVDVAYHKSIDESNKEVQKRIDEINNQLGKLAKPENNVEEEIQQLIEEDVIGNANKLNEEVGIDLFVARKPIEIKGEKFVLSQIKENNNDNSFIVENEKGEEIGKAQLSADGNFLENIRIDEKYRRKGLATQIYDFIEDRKGVKLQPSPVKQSNEAKALWDKRRKIEDLQPEIVKSVRVEQEPELPEGTKVVTLSGMEEGERVKAVEERKKKTTLTEKETLHNDLIDLANRVQKSRGNEKTNLQGQIRQRVRELNAKLGEEIYKYDGVSVRAKVKSKTKGERYLKIKGTTRDTSGRAIKEDAVLLFDRNPEFVQKYEELADSPNITALQVDSGNGVTMTADQIESALQDIADGIPSVQADNLLNALEEGFNRGYFDLRGKDIGQDRVQASVEDFIGVQQQEVGQQMDEDEVLNWLNEIQELPQEEQIEIDNIILEYEQQPQQIDISGKVQSPKPESKEGSPRSPKPSKEGEGNGSPKEKVGGEPIAEAKPKESVEEKGKDDIGSKARKLASDLRKGDKTVLPDWLKADLPKGTKLQGVDINESFAAALETFADVYDKVKDFKAAVEEGFKHIKDYFESNNIEYDETSLKNKFSNDLKEKLDLEEQRRFTARMIKTEGILPVAEIAKTLDYVKQKNAMSIEEANDIIKKVGLDEAFNLVKDSRDMNGGVRSVLGQSLISRYNNLAKIAADQAEKDFYWDKTIEVANYVTEKLATDAGQMIQAFSLWSKLSPEALFRNAQKDMQRQGEIAKKKAKKDTDAITKKLKKANEEAVEEVLASKELQSELGKVEQKEKSKAAAKIKKAQEKRKSIIDKYKNNKGGITLSTGGLTPEGIEFIGEVAKTYIDEGIANLELIVEKILEDYKSISGKDADKKIIDQIRDISSEKISDKLVKSTGKGIVDMKLKISEIVKQHYTEVDAIKKKLSDKFVKEAGLDPEQSKLLADKISAEFDRIANNKKKKILEQENKRLERAKNKLKPTKATSVKELHQLILKYTNLGGFGSDEILDLLAEKVGTGNLTREEGIRLQELAEKVRVAPDGSPKNDAIQNLLNYQAQLKGISAGELSQAVWYASLLAGYKTHIKNIVANLFNTFSELSVQGIKSPISSPFLMAGLFKGYRRGFIEAMHTLKTGKSPIHISKVEVSNVLEMKSFEGGMLNPFNLLKYVSRAMVAADVFAFQGLKEARSYQLAYSEAVKLGGKNITQKQYWNVRNPFDKKIWNIVNEKLFNTKQRYEDAVQIVQFEKLTGLEAKRRIFEIMEQTRDFKIVEDAYNFAARGTFNYPPEGVLGALNNRLSVFLDIQFGGTKPLRYIVPFTRILTNVANTALDYEPIIGIRRAIRGKIGFESFKESSVTKNAYREMTAEERRTQITKVAISISTIAMLYALSKMEDDEGNPIVEITGGGSIDFNKTNQLKERGWQPYSIKIGDKYYSYKLTPLIISLGYIGNLNDYEKYDSKGDSDMIDKMSQTAFRTSDILTDMTWVGSTTEFMDNFFSQGDEGKGKKMQKWLENQAKTAIPFMQPYTQISQGVQDLFNIPQKESSQFGANLIKDIPIARNYLYDKINVLGDKIYKSSPVVVSGKKVQNAESDVILDYLQSKNVFISPIKRQSVIIWDDKEKMERPLTMQEYYDYSKLRGELIKNEMIDLMNNGRWVVEDENEVLKRAADLNKDQLKKEVDNISKKATQKAKEILFVKEDN